VPRISVIIPVFNGAATVAAAIDSALAQEFCGEIEIIVVNDGSTDSTAAILEGFGARISVVNRTNGGLSAARNSGVAVSTGSLLAFLDADDLWMPEKLALMSAALAERPDGVLGYSDAVQIDDNGIETAPAFVTPELARAPSMEDLLTRWWPILPSTVVMPRSHYEKLGGFAAEMRSYEDMDFWLRARELGEFIYVPRALAAYRIASSAERLIKYEQSYALFVERMNNRYGKAARPMLRAIRHAHSSALGFRGLAAMSRGNIAEARRNFLRALQFEPFAPKTLLRLGRTFLPSRLARMLTGRTRARACG
jgi:glycosyltransferase involved in cell wall biosynthesis